MFFCYFMMSDDSELVGLSGYLLRDDVLEEVCSRGVIMTVICSTTAQELSLF